MRNGLRFSRRPTWVTEYDNTWTGNPVSNLLTAGATYTDLKGVVWDILLNASLGTMTFGVSATNGLNWGGGATGASDRSASLSTSIANLVAVGGGHTYDPYTDSIVVFNIYTEITLTAQYTWCAPQITARALECQPRRMNVAGTQNRTMQFAGETAVHVADSMTAGIIGTQMTGLLFGNRVQSTITPVPEKLSDLPTKFLTATPQEWGSFRTIQGTPGFESPQTPLLGLIATGQTGGGFVVKMSRTIVKRFRTP